MKKFYKDADEEDDEEGTEKVQGAKETEAKEGLGELGGDQKEADAPLLSSVFDEEAAATEENGAVTDASVKDHVDKDGIMMELGEAQNLEAADEKSEKPVTSAEEEPSNEETRLDENAGAAVENSETLKLVLEDTVAEALDDTVVEEKDGAVEEEKKGEEGEESLKLVLEPDTPIEEEEEIILSSQVLGGIQTLFTHCHSHLYFLMQKLKS